MSDPNTLVKGGIKFSIQPVKRPAEYASEKNDCAVRALSVAVGVPYADAHSAIQRVGRTSRRGTALSAIANLMNGTNGSPYIYGYKMTRVCLPPDVKTLGRAMPYLKRGRYMVLKTGHAIGCIDGVMHDSGTRGAGPQAKLWAIYKFTLSSEWEAKQALTEKASTL